jgi:site-specific recombinase XerD
MASIPKPKRPFIIPAVLSKEEIKDFLAACTELKYKTFFTLIYSTGLRLSEGLNIKMDDLDFARKMVRVTMPKGKRERFTIMGDATIQLLKEYMADYTPCDYLFYNTHNVNKPMSYRQTQSIFQYYLKKTTINKRAHIHTLRHSFATHLLENNVNIYYIMNLLGHASIKTTLIYLHMQRPDLLNIISPIDTMDINLPHRNVPTQLDFHFL